ncbi:MAG: hypothetical protein BWY26_01604 [Elusimicrobia bacterium ADurb.Bin231]|nr:MAG: hypothetical protein BWY26_01604 [Elusimicrobia bacterium ADurb.Bin231]
MEKLEKFRFASHAAVYKIVPEKKIKRFVITTPHTRVLLNKPEIIGFDFIEQLRNGVYEILKIFGEFEKYGSKNVAVVHFLRGGLNFGIVNMLHAAYGFNRTSASFITSQRYKKQGHWFIKDDQYRKFSLPEDANVFIGDVIATGTTLDNGLEILRKQAISEGKNIKRLIMFAVACARAEEILSKYHALFKKNFDYIETILVYFEGRFVVPNTKDAFHICIPGTDLVKRDALLAPEFIKSQSDKLTYPLERCAVYDVGARAYEYAVHIDDVINYWKKLSQSGMTLAEAYRERWPLGPKIKGTNTALKKLCNTRINFLRGLKNGK